MALKIEIGECFGEKMGRVIEQDSRCEEFFNGRSVFQASNGFRIYSISHPDTGFPAPSVYVWGKSDGADNRIFPVESEEWLSKLRVAVREYNQASRSSVRTEIIE